MRRMRKPAWVLPTARDPAGGHEVRRLMRELGLATVCESARCPNRGECLGAGTATFLILGDVCTRRCGFCAVAKGAPGPPDLAEPEAVAEAVRRLGLAYAVVTSVTRDDLPDSGAAQFAATIRAIRAAVPEVPVEVLVPDFAGAAGALETVLAAGPAVLNHNIETVPRLYPRVRPGALYGRSLGLRALLAFYIPLSLTSLLGLMVQPVGSAAMSRLPAALASLAVWPVVTGISFLLRSPGFAYNEVVVALVDEPDAARRLRRFALMPAVAATGCLVLLLLPPVARFWFEGVVGLRPELALLAQRSLYLALPLPAFAVIQSLYQGLIVDSRKTRGITEAVAASLAVIALLLWAAVTSGEVTGIYAAMAAFTVGEGVRTVWLRRRSRVPWRARLGD